MKCTFIEPSSWFSFAPWESASLEVYMGTFHWCSPPKKNVQCLECCVKGVMLTHASVSTLLLSVWCWTAMRGRVWVVAFSVLSKNISRCHADFFFGVACFFFPVGPRCSLRAGSLSLSVFHKLVNNDNKWTNENLLTVPTSPFDDWSREGSWKDRACCRCPWGRCWAQARVSLTTKYRNNLSEWVNTNNVPKYRNTTVMLERNKWTVKVTRTSQWMSKHWDVQKYTTKYKRSVIM